MRLLFVVQRYGHEVAGGAELHCRQFATRLAGRGHEVEALTSCAVSYVDWANHYPAGEDDVDGVLVHRLPVAHPRTDRLFGPLNRRVVWGRKPVALHLQEEWMRSQGPFLPGLGPWLERRSADYDVVVFFTYLYYTTWAGLPAVSPLTPAVLHPTAHDEPPLYLPLFETTFRHPSAFAFSTHEEADLVCGRFHVRSPSSIIGVGVDLEAGGDEHAFRSAHGLGDRPYLLFVGRVDPGKGSDELHEFFLAYKARNPGPLALVVVGDPVTTLPAHPDVVLTGFVDEATKRGALEGALALVQPSYFESFSMVLAEAWAHRRAALVQGRCQVLVGQCRRSGGGVPYCGYAEFEEAVNALIGDGGALCRRMGAEGRSYVERLYAWDQVLSRYERLLTRTARQGPAWRHRDQR